MIRRLHDVAHCPKLIAYGRKKHAQSIYANIPFDEAKAAGIIRSAMLSPSGAVWAAMDGNKIHGVLIGALVPYDFLQGFYATDLVFFADKEGPQLFRSFLQWAKTRQGVIGIQMGISSGMDEDGKIGRFYEMNGLKKIGGLYNRFEVSE